MTFSSDRPEAERRAAVLLALVPAWIVLALLVNTSQFGDHFEQYTWAQSLEPGYFKHPPLPTWVLGGLLRLGGPWPSWPLLLAGLATATTGLLLFLIARRLMGAPLAVLALLCWGLTQSSTSRAQLWNHNTTMLLCNAAAAWLALQALQRRRLGWWLATGVLAGLALLSKYQAVLGLAGILVALSGCGVWREPAQRRGLLLAIGVALLVFAPHLLWLLQHDFITLRYASEGDRSGLDLLARLRSTLSFTLIQLRMHLGLLLCLGLTLAWRWRGSPTVPATAAPELPDHWRRAWILGLFWVPVGLVYAAALLGGLRLQDHWGYQGFQFLGLALAWALRRRLADRSGLAVRVAVAVHLLAMLVYALPLWLPARAGPSNRPDTAYPAQALADAALRDWRQVTPCPLRYVVGPTFEAGMVAVYGGGRAAVVDSGELQRVPWIDAADLAAAGAIHIQMAVPPEAVRQGRLDLELPSNHGLRHETIRWSVVPPRNSGDCNRMQ